MTSIDFQVVLVAGHQQLILRRKHRQKDILQTFHTFIISGRCDANNASSIHDLPASIYFFCLRFGGLSQRLNSRTQSMNDRIVARLWSIRRHADHCHGVHHVRQILCAA